LPYDTPLNRRTFLKTFAIGYRTACGRIGEVMRAMWEFFGGAWMQPLVSSPGGMKLQQSTNAFILIYPQKPTQFSTRLLLEQAQS